MVSKKNFWSWQGNNMEWPTYAKWVVFSFIAILFFIIYINRKNIERNFSQKKRYFKFWKSRENFHRFLGYLGIVYIVAKIVIYEQYQYPLKWEYLQLHLCRIHFVFIMMAFITKKNHLIKYIAYTSVLGAVFGMGFAQLSSEDLPHNTLQYKLLDGIQIHIGPDNYFFYDFFVFHTFIMVTPIYLWVGYRWKFSAADSYRSQVFYISTFVFMWVFNTISFHFPNEWKANNWYVGPKEVNSYQSALGVFSKYPWNLITYIIIGDLIFNIANVGRIAMHKNRKELWAEFKTEHNKELKKNVFRSKERQVSS